jgi:hypothetical protein
MIDLREEELFSSPLDEVDALKLFRTFCSSKPRNLFFVSTWTNMLIALESQNPAFFQLYRANLDATQLKQLQDILERTGIP